MNVKVRINGVSKEVEKEYTEKAYGFCPYSKQIKCIILHNQWTTLRLLNGTKNT
ncbi:MAG: hypothetical protein K9L02_04850 [Acholeplasmataceae bacterium]|nr:hypothetical protein [Acholeplasmataceae bacterium]